MTRDETISELTEAIVVWSLTELERARAFSRIEAGYDVEFVDDVCIDFRHPDMPSGRLAPSADWADATSPMGVRGPWNVFDDPAPASLAQLAGPGDRIQLSAVEERDGQVYGFLRLKRGARSRAAGLSTSRDIDLPGPICFRRIHGVLSPTAALRQALNRQRADAPADKLEEEGLIDLAIDAALMMDECEASLDPSDPSDLISAAAVFGFAVQSVLVGKVLLPEIEQARAGAKLKREHSQRGGEKNRDWGRIKQALQEWKENPDASPHAVAKKIAPCSNVSAGPDPSDVESIRQSIRPFKRLAGLPDDNPEVVDVQAKIRNWEEAKYTKA